MYTPEKEEGMLREFVDNCQEAGCFFVICMVTFVGGLAIIQEPNILMIFPGLAWTVGWIGVFADEKKKRENGEDGLDAVVKVGCGGFGIFLIGASLWHSGSAVISLVSSFF